MPVNEQVVDSVTIDNVKVVGGGQAGYLSTLNQAHVGHMAALNQIRETALGSWAAVMNAATGSIIKNLTELDSIEAMANAVVGQQGAKIAQSTPPETARPTTGAPGPV